MRVLPSPSVWGTKPHFTAFVKQNFCRLPGATEIGKSSLLGPGGHLKSHGP